MIRTLTVQTQAREQLIDITRDVARAVTEFATRDGVAVLHVPHTTAGVTINENADPDVVRDVLLALERAVPNHPEFRHAEGNSAAHVKSSLVGCGAQVLVENGDLVLGTWQSIFFCEFDGPRTRKVHVTVR